MAQGEPARQPEAKESACRPGRGESMAVGLVVLGLCSLSCFVVAWWGAAFLHVSGLLALSEKTIALSAVAGLAVGLTAGVLNVRRLTRRFYTAPSHIVLCVYLFGAVCVTAFSMGLPLGLMGLGIVAGIYAGRRHALAGPGRGKAGSLARTSVLVASVTAAISLLMGALAVAERATMTRLLGLVGLGGLASTLGGRVAIVIVAVPAIFVIQYRLTLFSARWAARLGAQQPRRSA